MKVHMIKYLLVPILIFIIAMPVYANNNLTKKQLGIQDDAITKQLGVQEVPIVRSKVITNENNSQMQVTPRGLLLGVCSLRLINYDGGKIGVYADTSCYRQAETITMRIYLDVTEGDEDDWYTYDYYDYVYNASDHNNDLTFAYASFDLKNMDRSAHYRLRCNHLALAAYSNLRESAATKTDFIAID